MAKRTTFQTAVKRALESSAVHADKIICKADGSVEVRKFYFYRGGQTDWMWAEKVQANLVEMGLHVRVLCAVDMWQEWPKDSYFTVFIGEVAQA